MVYAPFLYSLRFHGEFTVNYFPLHVVALIQALARGKNAFSNHFLWTEFLALLFFEKNKSIVFNFPCQ